MHPRALSPLPLAAASILLASACAARTSGERATAEPTTAEPTTAEPTTAEHAPLAAAPSAPATPASAPGLDALLTAYDYPYPVAYREFRDQQQDLRLAYMDVQPETGPARGAVLLLHGKNFSGAYWARTIATLRERGWRVIVPDQIGFGKSTKPRAFQFSFQALASHTAALLDQLGVERVAVVGHSMGGMLATRFALMYPARTTGLVLVNPIGLEDWKRVVPYAPISAQYQAELARTPDAIKQYMTQSYFDGAWKPEYDPLLEIQAGWALGPDRELIAWVSALTADMIFTQPVLYEFGDVRVPTLLIIGQRDRTALGKQLVSREVAATLGDYLQLGPRAARAIPGARLVALRGVGHVPQYEAFPAYIQALIEFLDHPSRPAAP
jgi:pimeloyl-ACP methyl ester carboxylesterase